MKWPWVSRRAYDVLIDERDRLRVQNAELLEHVQRMDRVEHGVAETPRKPREDFGRPPKLLDDYINGFASPALRKEMHDRKWRMRAKGTAWEAIQAMIMEDVGARTP